ncbi:helix-turn-helix domain-containing protein [Nocardia sp. NPDC003482]
MTEGNSTLARRRLGRKLRGGRLGAGLTLQQSGGVIRVGASSVHRLERGLVSGVDDGQVAALCRIYEFDAEQTRDVLALVEEGEGVEWWGEYEDVMSAEFRTYVGLEGAAREIRSYEADLMPGLLHTPAYARVLLETLYPDEDAATIDRRVRLRMRRQELLEIPDGPGFQAVVRESAIRMTVGGPEVMAEQCERLVEASFRPNIDIRVLPFSRGLPMREGGGPFVLLDFGSDGSGELVETPLVYIESFRGEQYLTEPDVVRKHRDVYHSLLRNTLGPESSREMLRRAGAEFESRMDESPREA